MPPKKKGGKKKDDDWDADIGETVDPVATAEVTAKPDEVAVNNDEEGEMGGALMAALRNRKGKKGKKNQPTNDFVEGEDAVPVNGEHDLMDKAPKEGKAEEEDVFSMPVKQNGGKGEKPAPMASNSDDEEDEDKAGGGLKTKKEKEREKKEREKQRKKEQAAKRKGTTPAPAKPEPAKTAAAAKVEKPAAIEPAAPAAPSVKGGKVNKAIAAIQKQQEELRRKQEEQTRLEAEERAKNEELERQREEEEKKKEEARLAKKAKEKSKIEQQKREGKYLTKAQKEARAKAELRTKQLLEAGAKVAGLDAEGEAKKKPVYDNRKKKGPKKPEGPTAEELEAQKKLEELRIIEEQEMAAKAAAEKAKVEAEAKKAEEEEDLDDWEAMADAAEQDGVKESWDAPTDDEAISAPLTSLDSKGVHTMETTKSTKPAANGKTISKKAESSSSESDSEEEESSEEEEASAAQRLAAQRKADAAERRRKEHEAALAARSKDDLRSPICCILGHVDTGKTKLLDKIRQTNVQEGEAGGITQQIGATYFPVEALKKKTAVVNQDGSFEFKVPGLLVIDTPGHESFTNLRSRGSGLCNIAILVVDIMHGLEPQTLESMRLLRERKTPFIVALNKIDRLFGWKKIDNNGFQESLALQNKGVQNEFRDRLDKTKLAFAEQGFNSELYYENKSLAKNVSLVPTSAITGEGIPDMIKLIIKLTQERMTNSLMYLSEVEATVLEVKVIEGLGTTIDVILSNGVLREGDRIVLCGLNGAIATNIRALLTPAEMKELRVKSAYVHNKEVKAAIGVKISADGLDSAIAGSRLLVVGPNDDEEDLEDDVMSDLANMLESIKTVKRGVSVQASTLGSLEALLEFLRVSKIPVANISIGPVFRRDVRNAEVMLERAKEYAVMLCFDVKVDKEAEQYAREVGVKIFTADIIYHLFDAFTKHMSELAERKKEEAKMLAVFPCVLKPLAVFNKKDPIVVGVDVVEGNLRTLTPICAVKTDAKGQREIIKLGRVTSIEREHKAVAGNICKKGQPSVAVKIEGPNQPMYGRQLEDKDTLYSMISRESIDTLKEFYKDEVSRDEWKLMIELKKVMGIS